MSRHAKIMNGNEVFYNKLAVYLHLYKHKSQENLAEIFGVSRSTLQGWLQGFNRSRLESILNRYKAGGAPDYELPPGETESTAIRKILLQQANAGSTAAAKILLEIQEREEEILLEARKRILFEERMGK